VQVCEALSRELGLHCLQPPRAAASTVRARYDLTALRSKRRRSAAESAVLDAHGAEALVFELQGDLRFATIEPVLRAIVHAGAGLRCAVLDFQRVELVDAAALHLLEGLVNSCAGQQQAVVLTRVRRGPLMAGLGAGLDPRSARWLSFQPQLDLGLEWCERQILQRHASAPPAAPAAAGTLAEQQLCAGLSAADLAHLQSRVVHSRHEPGDCIVRCGDAADGLYFLLRGEVSVVVALPQGGSKRLSTLTAGMAFGELALVSGGLRSADVRADTAVECAALSSEAFRALQTERPALAIALLGALLQVMGQTARRLTAEVAALEA
jgi:glutaminase